jgi:hypothetical protein
MRTVYGMDGVWFLLYFYGLFCFRFSMCAICWTPSMMRFGQLLGLRLNELMPYGNDLMTLMTIRISCSSS